MKVTRRFGFRQMPMASTTYWTHPYLNISVTLFADYNVVVEACWEVEKLVDDEKDKGNDEDLEVVEIEEALRLIKSCSMEFYAFV